MVSIKAAPFQVLDTYVANKIKVSTLSFNIPLDHKLPSLEYIPVVAKVVNKYKPTLGKQFNLKSDVLENSDNLLLFLQGGPGFQTPTPSNTSDPAFLCPLLDRNYTVVFLDQRGTGLSNNIDADSLVKRGTTEDQFDYIKHFRADSIVFDAEAIRLSLSPESKWSLLGQSFGGFTSVSYMSMFPKSLKKVMLTGGLPPIGIKDVGEVYSKTYQRTAERNMAYYKAFPNDVLHVWGIVEYLQKNNVTLPNGGTFSVDRFRHLGLSFGGSGGTLELHKLVVALSTEIQQRGTISYKTKMDVQNYLGFETNVIYFLFQEAIYCNGEGVSSNWAAHSHAPDSFKITHGDYFMFTGEMVYPNMTDDYVELSKLKKLSMLIHSHAKWSKLYDLETLKTLQWDQLPVAAAVYLDDQYVDYQLSQANENFFHYEKYVTNSLFHNGLRASSSEVLDKLFDLIEFGSYK